MKKFYFFCLLLIAIMASYAQAPVVSFACHDENNNPQRLDSVRIENWTRSWTVTIYYPNLTISLADVANGVTEVEFDDEGLARNIPNPFNGRTRAQLTLPNNEHIIMRVFDITGKAVAYYEGQFEAGKHDFDIVLSTPQTYILQVATSRKTYAIKMVNTGNGGENKINLLTSNNEVVLKSAKQIMDYDFEIGDCMHYQGFVTVGNEAVRTDPITQNQYESELITFTILTTIPTVTTGTISEITSATATCGGNIIATGGSAVIARGICWSISQNPTINDSHTFDGSDTGSFTSNITGLNPSTTYYVRAYATNSVGTAYGSQVSFTTTSSSTGQDGQPCPGTTTVNDYDNNIYNTVQIGNQCWMKENLRTTHYANGDSIALGSSASTTTAYRYNPNNNSSNVSTYGYLYNWKAVMGGLSSSSANPSGVQGICPNGWHVPSDAEWTQLTDYVSSQTQYQCNHDSYYITKALASNTSEWNNSTISCTIGKNPSTNNATGFSAFPVGYYAGYYYGHNENYWNEACFWSATEYGDYAYDRTLYYEHVYVLRDNMDKSLGLSVRCVRNATDSASLPLVTTNTVSSITPISARGGGNVTAMVTTRGVCWSTSQNPTINDSHTSDGSGTGSFTSSITGLNPGTTYYVRAYATNSVGTAYGSQMSFTTTSMPTGQDGQPCLGTIAVTDYDNNIYSTVQIGNQCWMKENLRTTHYSNGTSIALGSSTSTTTAFRYYPNNNSSIVSTYGYLYNWKAVMGSSSSSNANPSGVLGICPNGWHVPSSAEWTQLTDYVGSQTQYQCYNNSYYIAKALASTTGWNSDGEICAVGCQQSTNNATGFSALPIDHNSTGSFWSTTEFHSPAVISCDLHVSDAYMFMSARNKSSYCFVRCVRNATDSISLPLVTTNTVSSITTTSATCGSNVTSDGGAAVTARGVCWSTSQNPTINDSHTSDGSGTGSFTSSITGLNPDVTYYVRSYATNSVGTAYSSQVSFTATSDPTGQDGLPCLGAATVTDIDSNTYNTVQIGNQCWMKENMRTTHYANGESIALGSSTSTTTAYRYNPNNNSSNVSTYGYLYNWKAVMGGLSSSSANPSGVQGICPNGWHVPSVAEWTQLTDYVGSQTQYQCYNNSYYIAKALASTTGWNSYTYTCAVGNNPSTNNATGFSALPAGDYNGNYNTFGYEACFWSTTKYVDDAYFCYLQYSGDHLYSIHVSKDRGFSVRCVRNATDSLWLPSVTTNTVSGITTTSAICGGNVTATGGTNVTAIGVCWSTSQNPTINDSHTSDGSSTGSFTSFITGLNPSTTYYVRSYATNSVGTVFGSQVSFTTTSSSPGQDGQPCLGIAMVNDYDNNTYNTVQIGNQCWMKENLRTTHYANGESIALGSITGSTSTTTAYRYYPGNSSSNVSTYGYLYNWAAVMHGASSSTANPCGVQGICPTGWHIPSDVEWTQLTDYVSSQTQYQCGSTSTFIAKSLASTTEWDSRGETCAVGYYQITNNATGFSALPAGDYLGDLGHDAHFWCSTESNGNSAYCRRLAYNNAIVNRYSSEKCKGKSVRCVRDTSNSVSVTTNTVSNITATSATCGGNVTSTGGLSVTARGVCWSTSQNPTVNDSHTTNGTGSGSFTSNMTGLSINTTYYVRAYATNNAGTAYGNQITFTTPNIPTVTTNTVSSITGTTASCGGNVTATGGLPVTARGVCWSTSQNPTVSDSYTTNGSGMGNYTSNMTGLSIGTTYYVRAYATNSAGTAYGNQLSFTTPDIPTVTTNTVSSITTSTASCGGNVTATGGANITARGVCWSTSQNPTVSDSYTTNGTGIGSFTSSITGLNPATTYYIRAYATNSAGTAYGIQRSFTTQATVPTVTTNNTINNITATTATCGGNVTSTGGASVTARGICWSTSAYPTVSGSHTTNGSGTGSFTSDMTELTPGTTYYLRAYATNSAGTAYGTQQIFTTLTTTPSVTTNTVSSINPTSATCGGNVTSTGGLSVTARGVCWSTSQNPTVNDSHTTNGTGSGSFTCNMTGLTHSTTYYVRAYATNSMGTSYGEQRCFTTQNDHGQTCSGVATVTDIDNNTYNTVKIGNQCWMKENLRTTHYANGESIALGSSTSTTTAYRYNPNNNSSNVNTYGYLYNWAAVMHGTSSSSSNPSGRQGVCPNGWHVPSEAEWTQLENYVKSQSAYRCNSTSTNIAKALSSITGWSSNTEVCAPGNTPANNNATGFGAQPEGRYTGSYSSFGHCSNFWSCTVSNSKARAPLIYYDRAEIKNYSYDKHYSFSVRCVKD